MDLYNENWKHFRLGRSSYNSFENSSWRTSPKICFFENIRLRMKCSTLLIYKLQKFLESHLESWTCRPVAVPQIWFYWIFEDRRLIRWSLCSDDKIESYSYTLYENYHNFNKFPIYYYTDIWFKWFSTLKFMKSTMGDEKFFRGVLRYFRRTTKVGGDLSTGGRLKYWTL